MTAPEKRRLGLRAQLPAWLTGVPCGPGRVDGERVCGIFPGHRGARTARPCRLTGPAGDPGSSKTSRCFFSHVCESGDNPGPWAGGTQFDSRLGRRQHIDKDQSSRSERPAGSRLGPLPTGRFCLAPQPFSGCCEDRMCSGSRETPCQPRPRYGAFWAGWARLPSWQCLGAPGRPGWASLGSRPPWRGSRQLRTRGHGSRSCDSSLRGLRYSDRRVPSGHSDTATSFPPGA